MNNLNVNGMSFRGKYLIPYNQIKSEEMMQKVGLATAQYITDPNQIAEAPNGIIVDIDDKRVKEYEAIVAKYGVNIQKYDSSKAANKNVAFNGNPEETSVKNPEVATAKINEVPTTENPAETNHAEQ